MLGLLAMINQHNEEIIDLARRLTEVWMSQDEAE